MAVNCIKYGRPPLIAKMDFSIDIQLAFWDKFFEACGKFQYAEIMAVSRALNVHYHTVEKWKYGLQIPKKKETAEAVLAWIEQGKPTERLAHSRTTSMLE